MDKFGSDIVEEWGFEFVGFVVGFLEIILEVFEVGDFDIMVYEVFDMSC